MLRSRTVVGPLLVLLALCLAAPADAEETLLLLARHAEKQDDSANPDLTPRGLERAAALAEIALEWNVRAVYSTDFCRTAQTAQPTAAGVGMPIAVQPISNVTGNLEHCTPRITSPLIFLDPKLDGVADLLSWILEQHAGQTVLIVGHSNTIPRMLARLGVGVFQIEDDQYDRLFMVTHDSAQGARVVESSYGEKSLADEAAQRLPIVDRAIAFHGGEAFRSSTTRLTITSRSGAFDLEVTRNGGSFRYLVTDRVATGARTTEVTNDDTRRLLAGEPLTLDAAQVEGARDFAFARVYFPFLPYGLNDDNVYKRDQGLERWGERDLHRVKVTFAPGSSTDAADDYAFWFDPETGRLEQYAYSFDNGKPTGGLRFRRLTNYRRVGGLLFADASNEGVNGDGDFTVDTVDPEWARDVAQPVSTVLLSNITVEPLAGD